MQLRDRVRRTGRPIRVAALALLALLIAAAAVATQPQPATRSLPVARSVPAVHIDGCGDVKGPRWRVGGGSDDRWDVIATDTSLCAMAKRYVPSIAGRRASGGSALTGGPSGWTCYATATSGLDGRPVAGTCRDSAHRFFAWLPPGPAATPETDV